MRANEQGLNPAPLGLPDIHPNVAGLYLRQIERLAEALNDPEDRAEAATAPGSAWTRSRSNGDRCVLGKGRAYPLVAPPGSGDRVH